MSIFIYSAFVLINLACLCVPNEYSALNIVAAFICGGALGWEVASKITAAIRSDRDDAKRHKAEMARVGAELAAMQETNRRLLTSFANRA